MLRPFILAALVSSAFAALAPAQDLPKGQVIPSVAIAADAKQTYALYLPSNYSPDRKWNLLVAFDPRARGQVPVDLYKTAAEKYGYIVAGSNVSRNGPTNISLNAARAMLADLSHRFSIDEYRMYITGLSGGSRFALDYAINTGKFAGVIASSAGLTQLSDAFSEPFAIFGTTGTEDFNYLEMRQFDRQLTSQHHLRVFVGDHTWPPPEVAMEAIEWMEMEAMKAGRRPKDNALIDRLFDARKAELAALTSPADIYFATAGIASEFQGLRDVASYAAKKSELGRSQEVRDSVRAMLNAEQDESQIGSEFENLTDQLGNSAERDECLGKLRDMIAKLSAQAKEPTDTPERRIARRVLRGALADNTSTRQDPEYRKMLEAARP